MGKCLHYMVNFFVRKISKFDATRCQILRLKCTKFDFRWGSAQTPLGELTTLLAVFKVPTSKGREERGRGTEGRDLPDQCQTASYALEDSCRRRRKILQSTVSNTADKSRRTKAATSRRSTASNRSERTRRTEIRRNAGPLLPLLVL